MMNCTASVLEIKRKYSYLWLVLGGILSFFINGEYLIPILSWIAPVFVVHFYRVQRNIIGIVLPLIIWVVSLSVSFYGMVPLPVLPRFLVLIGIGLITFFPFLIDRFWSVKISGFLSTFILPLAAVSIEYLSSIFNPYATWASFAYTQFESLSLIQIASITGIWGITFLLFWFYSFINWLWDHNFQIHKVKKGIITFTFAIVLVLIIGEVKIFYSSFFQDDTVKVAGITVPNMDIFRDEDLDKLQEQENIELERKVSGKLTQLQDTLIELTAREAAAGSKVIFWSEGNGIVLKNDEKLFINRVNEIAKTNQAYILMSLATITPGEKIIENKAILINENGEIAYTYHKGKPVPGEMVVKGDNVIKFVDTQYGRIGSVICYDMDFPSYIRQAGKSNIDILLVPSLDWKEIDPLHTHMAAFRAIENGFNMFRQTNSGLSLATDYNGKPIAKMDHFNTEDRVLTSHIPTKGITTFYAIAGDYFAWVCILVLLIFRLKIKE